MYHKCTIISFPHFTSFNSANQYTPNNQQHKYKQNSSKFKKPNPGGITKTRTSIGFDACFVLFPAGNVSLLTIHAGNKTKKAAPRPFLVFVAIGSQRGRDASAIARANSGGAYGCARHCAGEFRRKNCNIRDGS